jgi:hypothetical protein
MVAKMKCLILILLLLLIFSSIVLAQGPELEITDYENEILAERGWIRYLNVKVKNIGETYLSDVEVFVEGQKSSWFETQTEMTGISPNRTESFIIKMYIPSDEQKGRYDLTLAAKSGDTTVRESLTVRVFASRSEMVLYQIQGFKDRISELKSEADIAEEIGKNVEPTRELLIEAQSVLNGASGYVADGQYEEAANDIIDAENLIKKAEYELSIASAEDVITSEAIPIEWILIIALVIIILLMFTFFAFNRRRPSRRVPMVDFQRGPRIKSGLKIKKLLREGRMSKKAEEEISRLKEAESLLEEEYSEGLISKESYEELKAKYEEKILDVRTRRK